MVTTGNLNLCSLFNYWYLMKLWEFSLVYWKSLNSAHTPADINKSTPFLLPVVPLCNSRLRCPQLSVGDPQGNGGGSTPAGT